MGSIRPLKEEDMQSFAQIAINAYPGIFESTEDALNQTADNFWELQLHDSSIEHYGYWKDGLLAGGMRLYSFQMNFHGKMIQIGGVGLVCVDLLHKKEKIAKEMIDFFLRHFEQKGINVVALYPFRPDFYKKMGFGYGTKMHQYKLAPNSFPYSVDKSNLVYLDSSHKDLLIECASRSAHRVHGMFIKSENEIKRMLSNPKMKTIGYLEGETLKGFIQFYFKKGSDSNFIYNHLVIKELVYESPDALAQICTFLHSQQDQIQQIILNTQDSFIDYLLSDPRNGTNHLIPSVYHETNTSGTGIMYRIINIERLLHDMATIPVCHIDKSCRINIQDTFMHQDQKQTVSLMCIDGTIRVKDAEAPTDFEAEIDISDFTSMMMGNITAARLYLYGKLQVSDADCLETLERLCASFKPPICTTGF
ncbi:GNAT family N-acetyltransferase [Falsibacillus albus]|uniref:GNAT family N-acetyltransferase n=1 Tax=Falsibacillus albus TaxID=2478915 RepID=A0A3L7JZL2_9BACI|nr:GNAT family N-acetyltransferase [Falsibacillus albus]RLQ96186.1 GNAT family N-acetyltransferase [Falsibacillus albus]